MMKMNNFGGNNKNRFLLIDSQMINRFSNILIINLLILLTGCQKSEDDIGKKDTIKSRYPPIFYDEATLHNASLDLIAKTIALNYNKEVVASTKNHNLFTIKIPKIGFEDLNQYMTEQYGITLKKSIGKVPGYKIRTAD